MENIGVDPELQAESNGTAVRCASAFALGEILPLKLEYNTSLLPKIHKLANIEEDKGVKNKYIAAQKKVTK